MPKLPLSPKFVPAIGALFWSVIRFGRQTCAFRCYSLLLIVTLLTQVFVIGPVPRTRAALPQQAPASISVQREGFLINESPRGGFLNPVVLAANVLSVIPDPFADPRLPDGLVLAAQPSLVARLALAASPLLALINPLKSTAPALKAPSPTSTASVSFDFDGDGKADIGRWHASTFEMKVVNSNGGSSSTYTLGSSTSAKPAPGDFDGDGTTNAGVFLNGTWTYKPSPSSTPITISVGTSGDIPVAGDYDGDTVTDAAVYRPSTSTGTYCKAATRRRLPLR